MLDEKRPGRLGKGLFVGEADDPTKAGGAGGAAAPTFVPTDDFKLFQTQVLQQFENIGASLKAISASAVARGEQPPKPVEPEVITTEQYAEAVREGNVEIIEKYYKRQQFDTIRQLAPSLQLGLDSVGLIVAASAATKLPYYKRFKEEIDRYVGGMTSEMRMTPQAYEIAHNVVVGRNAPIITQEAVEAALRSANVDPKQANAGSGAGSRAGGGGSGGGQAPSVAELFGPEAEAALVSKGDTPDSWARKLGYKDWAMYAGFVQKQREGGE